MLNPNLKTFLCVADCGSFSKASEKLYISTPSVMKQINVLEKHLELKLFDRTSQGIRLTPAGRVLYRHTKTMEEYAAQALAEARRESERAETTFCIGSSILNPCKPFMDLWYQVNQAFPGYKLHIVPFEDDHQGILSEISALGEKFDFLVGVCDSRQWLDRCNFYQLGTFQHCCAVSREHPLAQKEHLTIEDLYGQTLMMVKRGDSRVVDQIREQIERHPQIRIEDTPQFYDMEVFNRCAQTGNVMVTLECWRDVHPSLVTIPVEWDHAIPYGLLYAKNPSADIERFLKAVRELRAKDMC
ncbi:LysR family transcriptional regulator [Butyricicoccus sp.]|uniref:LysR family transcriptional regulator n=1 Tax=Butyricicoccus sp. TaxID=2049021 RepID=UPI0037350DEE